MSCTILSVPVDDLDASAVRERIKQFVSSGKSHHIVTANTIMIYQACFNPALARAFSKAHLVVADSVGVVWAARFLKESIPRLFPGIDLMISCMGYAAENGWSVYLLGSKQVIMVKAVDHIKKQFPSLNIAGFGDGYFSPDNEDAVIREISALHPVFLFVGLDTPRQEIWISQNLEKLHASVVIGVGGSFDVLSGELSRAPQWIRKAGCEWLFRTLQEPWRLWRIRQLPLFVWKVLLQKLRS